MDVTTAEPRAGCAACVRVVAVASHGDARGTLASVDFGEIGFDVIRAFVVEGEPDSVRGGHAHRRGRQVLMLASGEVLLHVIDHGHHQQLHLPADGRAVLLEPGVWAQQTYLGRGSAIAVFCDTSYDPDDYVLDPDASLALR